MSLKWVPNAITMLRCAMAILVGYAILDADVSFRAHREVGSWVFIPFGLFALTAATDWLDGAMARMLDAQSKLGARLDPIADKILTAAALLALSHAERWDWYLALPTLAIVGRDFLLTAMREALGNPPNLKVSRMAKWKTAITLSAIGALLLGMAISEFAHYADPFSPAWVFTRGCLLVGLAGLWIAAILSVITAVDYVSAAGKPAE